MCPARLLSTDEPWTQPPVPGRLHFVGGGATDKTGKTLFTAIKEIGKEQPLNLYKASNPDKIGRDSPIYKSGPPIS